MRRFTTGLWAAGLLVGGFGCDGPVAGSPPHVPIDDHCRLVALNSDYSSTTVSLLKTDGEVCAGDVLGSGSAPPGLVTAISGDVVLPSSPHPAGWVTLIDRFPNAVLTFYDAVVGEVVAQISVATGFPSNPQDVHFFSSDRAWVSRASSHTAPTSDPADLDEGGDVLLIDPSTGALRGRIDLQSVTDTVDGEVLDPRPGRMAVTGGSIWLGLSHLSRDMSRGGDGLVARLDPTTETLSEVIRLEGRSNCGRGVVADPTGEGVWVVCTGVFAEGPDAQLARSGLAWIDGPSSTLAWGLDAAQLGGQPLSFSALGLSDRHLLVIRLGDLAAGTLDQLLLVDRDTNEVREIDLTSGAFELGGMLLAPGDLVLIADADPVAPRLHRLPWVDGVLGPALLPVEVSPHVGLPARGLALFR